MKRAIILIVVAFGCIYFWQHTTTKAPSGAQRQEELERLKFELAIDEKALSLVEEKMASIRANAPYCPVKDGPADTVFKNDPRPDLRKKIEEKEAKIRELE